jgi:hypothetical protein
MPRCELIETIFFNHPLDFSIWSKVELSNFDFHINFTEPATEEFKRVKKLLENEVS